MDAVAAPNLEVTNGDCLVLDRVNQVLQASGYLDLRRLRCEYDDGIVTIKGHVGSYFLKQMAQVLAARVEGVTGINNQLRVASSFSADRDRERSSSWIL